jgi:hypothetical protein
MSVALWLNLARSGGTLLSRCLGCMRGVVLLSEVHPLGVRIIDPAVQAARWHGLLSRAELPRWEAGRGRYDELVTQLEERAARRGKSLVLRDWSHLDFVGVPFAEPCFASRSSALLARRVELKRFAMVRHPADQWVSQQGLDLLRGRVEPELYLRGCRAFAELAAQTGFVRYEDFTREPEAELSRLCAGLGVPYDSGWRDRYRGYANVTGDPEATSRMVGEIRPSRRREPAADMHERFGASEDYRKACELLGYEP